MHSIWKNVYEYRGYNVTHMAKPHIKSFVFGYSFLPLKDIPLISLPEGILNSMAIAALIIFKPSWVVMYDEDKYLKNF